MSRQRMWQIGAAALLVVLMLFGVGYYVVTSGQNTSTASGSAITDTTPPVDPDPTLTTTTPETTSAPLPQTVSGKGTQGSTGIVQNSGGTVQNPPSGPSASETFAPFIGEWRVNGSVLTINTNQTGTEETTIGPCLTGTNAPMCNQVSHLSFTTSPDGITAKVQAVTYEQWDKSQPPAGYQRDTSGLHVGDSFFLAFENPNLLRTTYLGRISSWNNPDRNVNWCSKTWENDIANGIQHPECGA